MAAQIFCYIAHKNGKLDDTAAELLAAARKIDAGADVTAVVFGAAEAGLAAKEAADKYAKVWVVKNDALAYPNAEIIRPMLKEILPAGAILLLPFDSFGLDLGPGLSVKMDAAYVADVVDFEAGAALTAVRQEYSGQVSVKVSVNTANGAVFALRPGAFPGGEVSGAGGAVEGKSPAVPAAARKFLEVVPAEVGDVDITKEDVLVSIGRGIESQDNLEIAFDLSKAMGAEVSCSRPIVDAKWLEKSRQVGTSGQTVKPKVYMALGISGAFQHLGGLKGNPFVVAINKNPKAPIFQIADVGIVGNILEYIPALAEKIQEGK
jgi:electron transfer flavoprotein alpha subunit